MLKNDWIFIRNLLNFDPLPTNKYSESTALLKQHWRSPRITKWNWICVSHYWTSRQFKSFMGITAFLSKIENCRGYTWDWRRVTCPVIEANGKLYFFYNRQFGYYFVIIPKMFYYFFQINCIQVYSGETSLTVVSFRVQNNGFARTWIFTYRLVRLQMYHIPIDLNNNSSYYLSAISMLRKDEGLQSILQVWNVTS